MTKMSGIEEYEEYRNAIRHIDVLYVNVFVVRETQEGAFQHLLVKRRGDVPLPNSWQPLSGKIREGESIKDAFRRQVDGKTGINDYTLYRTDTINLYYDEYYDAVLAVPFALAVTKSCTVTLDPSLHVDFSWTGCNQAIELLQFEAHRTFVRDVESNLRRNRFSILL